ncbi:hypothetical protein ETB97_011118 [Aspergillus alliaceus]|uniref:NmrA-like domain-containing protein n=1 Tax=Petromyces alliaceus TaxID=209559 RepID=A0A8H5ZTE4_PETAA|nr:hypothetical protein ETB97_011118 [Aspergillus burnettii]
MSAPKIVLVANPQASGPIGLSLLNSLLNAGLPVTVLTRQSKTQHTLTPRAQVLHVDYNSLTSLQAAHSNHDILINALPPRDLNFHLRFIDAPLAAGIKRLLPSKFGPDTTNPLASKLPVYASKIAV